MPEHQDLQCFKKVEPTPIALQESSLACENARQEEVRHVSRTAGTYATKNRV